MDKNILDNFILSALKEDLGDGDHTSLACIANSATGKAKLLIKDSGVLAGMEVIKRIYEIFSKHFILEVFINDGEKINKGDIAYIVKGETIAILQTERLSLNILQRMSGIATTTRKYADQLTGLKTKVLDTRKTTPNVRFLEKEAVKIGGGENHRMGLYDMILIKDNHIDYAGGIEPAIIKTKKYLSSINKNLKIEIEGRNIEEIREIIRVGGIERILLDNFTIDETKEAVKLINGKYETESSGGINIETIRKYAECGVDYISVGALTHQILSLDMSLKAIE
ncbi:carboxylating nicotinate-nucleotide diphosphorylase [Bacteroidota bacterium]